MPGRVVVEVDGRRLRREGDGMEGSRDGGELSRLACPRCAPRSRALNSDVDKGGVTHRATRLARYAEAERTPLLRRQRRRTPLGIAGRSVREVLHDCQNAELN